MASYLDIFGSVTFNHYLKKEKIQPTINSLIDFCSRTCFLSFIITVFSVANMTMRAVLVLVSALVVVCSAQPECAPAADCELSCRFGLKTDTNGCEVNPSIIFLIHQHKIEELVYMFFIIVVQEVRRKRSPPPNK